MSELIDNLMQNYDDNHSSYKHTVEKGNLGYCPRITLKDYRKWENLLSRRLSEHYDKYNSLIRHDYFDNEAKKHFDTFLYYYGTNHRTVCSEITNVQFPVDKFIYISLRNKQSIANKVSGKLGSENRKFTLLLSQVRRIKGSPLAFECYLECKKKLVFGGDGNVMLVDVKTP